MAKVYYSGSIYGAAEADIELPQKIVEFIMNKGHEVLSKHVALPPNHVGHSGKKMKLPDFLAGSVDKMSDLELCRALRKFDTESVDAAEFIVVLANAPSHGVGMEIERALLRKERGLSEAKILLLAHKDGLQRVSGMVRGINPDEYPNSQIFAYDGFEDIKKSLQSFYCNQNRCLAKLTKSAG